MKSIYGIPPVLNAPKGIPALDLGMCTDFGPDRLQFAGLIPERVKKVKTT